MVLKGKTAVVTGAAGTLGLAVARALLEDGAQVALVDIDTLRLDSLIRFLRGTMVAVSCDVTDGSSVRNAHQQVEKVLGPVDILVNAAELTGAGKLEATEEGEWQRMLAINVGGAYHWSRAVLASMRSRGFGRIVNVGSLEAKNGGASSGVAYATSKGALAAFTFALAREVAANGITVNAVAASHVKTATVTEQMTEAQRRLELAQMPMGRFCEPEEFAHAVRFLCSPLAGFITGEIVDVNGGLHMD
jgi:3-oxoacyl-[acyl-carrier protein] reductase